MQSPNAADGARGTQQRATGSETLAIRSRGELTVVTFNFNCPDCDLPPRLGKQVQEAQRPEHFSSRTDT